MQCDVRVEAILDHPCDEVLDRFEGLSVGPDDQLRVWSFQVDEIDVPLLVFADYIDPIDDDPHSDEEIHAELFDFRFHIVSRGKF